MFFKQTINKIKFLNKDKESYPDLVWLKKDQESLRQFIVRNPANVRKGEEASLKIVEKVNFNKLNAQEARKFAFLGLKLKPMPIIIPILIIATILTGGGITAVQAQDSLPGQTLYPVKMVTEKVQLAFSGQEGDIKLHAKFASKRAGELEELISQTPEQGSQTPEQGMEAVEIKTELIKDTASKLKQEIELSEKGLTALAGKGKDVTELALKVEEATSNHLEVLTGLITTVPVQAQQAVEQAREASQKGQATALEAIIQAGEKGYSDNVKPMVEERVKVRLEQAKGKIEEAQGKIKSIAVIQSGGSGMLLAECADTSYITEKADYIIEGIVKEVRSKWNEEKTRILTYTDLAIKKYIKGTSFGNYLQIITPGGTVGDVGEWAEDQPVFRQGKKVRVYFQETNGEFSIVCAQFGVKEISQIVPDSLVNPVAETMSEQGIKQAGGSIQEAEGFIKQGNLPKALQEINNVNVIINEMETTIPKINSEPDVSPAIGFCGDGRCSAPSETYENCPEDCKKLIPYGDDGINVNKDRSYGTDGIETSAPILPRPDEARRTGTTVKVSPDANEQSYIYPTDVEEVKVGGLLTLEQATKIALSNKKCVEYDLDTKSGSYNKNSNTWWFNLKHKTDICDYACVVYGLDQAKRSEVYPMCRGLIVPDDKTANWQTYKNSEYGFEFKYPKDLIINQTDSNTVTIGSQVMPYITIERYPSRQNIDFQSFVQEKLVEDFGSLLDVNKIKWTEWAHKDIFNQYAIDAEFENVAGGYTGNVVWTYFVKGDWVYRISALQGYNNADQKAFQNQILSTFKFLD